MLKRIADRFQKLFMEHPFAPYLIVIAQVEAVTYIYHVIFEPERLLFEIILNGSMTVLIAVPMISMVLGQHRKLEAFSKDLERLSTTDQMTGLLNRQSFLERIAPALQSAGEGRGAGSFAYVDADCFKKLNDEYGHAVGDKAIILIAQIIRTSIRAADLCSRLGGEEFGIFLNGANIQNAAIVAERIRQRVHAESLRAGMPAISVSIGVAAHQPGMPLDELMQHADRSLYVAKEQGRDSVVVELERFVAA